MLLFLRSITPIFLFPCVHESFMLCFSILDSELPLFGNFGCKMVAQPNSIVQDTTVGYLNVQVIDQSLKFHQGRVLASRVSGRLLDSLVHDKYLILGKKPP